MLSLYKAGPASCTFLNKGHLTTVRDGMQMRISDDMRQRQYFIPSTSSPVCWHLNCGPLLRRRGGLCDPSHVSKIHTGLSSLAIVLLLISSDIRHPRLNVSLFDANSLATRSQFAGILWPGSGLAQTSQTRNNT